MSECHIVAIFVPQPGKADRLRELLDNQAKSVQEREDYCSRFVVTEQLENDNPEIALFETYKDRGSITRHGGEPHFKAMMETLNSEEVLAKKPYVLYTRSISGFEAR